MVLLIEDDVLVGMDLSEALEEAGYRVIGPLTRISDVRSALEEARPAAAVVDVRLKDGSCAVLASELRERRIPYLVHTGCQRGDPLAAAFLDVPWLAKPAAVRDVLAVLHDLARGSRVSS
ncbi:histidine kinase [Methylobacterium sp. ID0610]|uniref:histidine kinase n=1 Tax=Methylobacterium carpenticola TaxID=3344827 RepID=UPI00369EF866